MIMLSRMTLSWYIDNMFYIFFLEKLAMFYIHMYTVQVIAT
jgi:hypothetical protein